MVTRYKMMPAARKETPKPISGRYAHKLAPVIKPEVKIDEEEFRRKFCGSTAPKTVPQYTGDKLIGIGLRHKSGFEPVFSEEQAVALAQMRR